MMYLPGRRGAFVVRLILTLIGWIPGVIHAFFVVSDARADRRAQETIETIRRERGVGR